MNSYPGLLCIITKYQSIRLWRMGQLQVLLWKCEKALVREFTGAPYSALVHNICCEVSQLEVSTLHEKLQCSLSARTSKGLRSYLLSEGGRGGGQGGDKLFKDSITVLEPHATVSLEQAYHMQRMPSRGLSELRHTYDADAHFFWRAILNTE